MSIHCRNFRPDTDSNDFQCKFFKDSWRRVSIIARKRSTRACAPFLNISAQRLCSTFLTSLQFCLYTGGLAIFRTRTRQNGSVLFLRGIALPFLCSNLIFSAPFERVSLIFVQHSNGFAIYHLPNFRLRKICSARY